MKLRSCCMPRHELSVFPVPGGRSGELLWWIDTTRRKSSGFVKGNSMTSRISRICLLSPPILAHVLPCVLVQHIVHSRIDLTSQCSHDCECAHVNRHVWWVSAWIYPLDDDRTTYRGPLDALIIILSSSS